MKFAVVNNELVPLHIYQDACAKQFGFKDFDDMLKNGFYLDDCVRVIELNEFKDGEV